MISERFPKYIPPVVVLHSAATADQSGPPPNSGAEWSERQRERSYCPACGERAWLVNVRGNLIAVCYGPHTIEQIDALPPDIQDLGDPTGRLRHAATLYARADFGLLKRARLSEIDPTASGGGLVSLSHHVRHVADRILELGEERSQPVLEQSFFPERRL